MSPRPQTAAVRPLRPLAPAPADADLVTQAATGSRPARAELYERHVDAVLGQAGRLLGRRGEAEDVTQEAFMTAFRDLSELRAPAAFGAWVRQIAVRLVHRRFRRRRLLERLGLNRGRDDLTLAALAVTADPETIALLGQVDAAVRSLPTDQRLAWMLRYVEGCELKEIAASLGCSLATAKRRVASAQDQVRTWVDVELAPQTGGKE